MEETLTGRSHAVLHVFFADMQAPHGDTRNPELGLLTAFTGAAVRETQLHEPNAAGDPVRTYMTETRIFSPGRMFGFNHKNNTTVPHDRKTSPLTYASIFFKIGGST